MKHKKATEDAFNELHNRVTKELLARVKSGGASIADIKAAIDWLKQNDITGVQVEGNPLDKLNKVVELNPELIQERLYGKQHF